MNYTTTGSAFQYIPCYGGSILLFYGENHRDGQLCTDSAAVVFLVGKVRVKSALRLYRKTGGFSGGENKVYTLLRVTA